MILIVGVVYSRCRCRCRILLLESASASISASAVVLSFPLHDSFTFDSIISRPTNCSVSQWRNKTRCRLYRCCRVCRCCLMKSIMNILLGTKHDTTAPLSFPPHSRNIPTETNSIVVFFLSGGERERENANCPIQSSVS